MLVIEAQRVGCCVCARVGQKYYRLEPIPIRGVSQGCGLKVWQTDGKWKRKEQAAMIEHADLPGSYGIEIRRAHRE